MTSSMLVKLDASRSPSAAGLLLLRWSMMTPPTTTTRHETIRKTTRMTMPQEVDISAWNGSAVVLTSMISASSSNVKGAIFGKTSRTCPTPGVSVNTCRKVCASTLSGSVMLLTLATTTSGSKDFGVTTSYETSYRLK